MSLADGRLNADGYGTGRGGARENAIRTMIKARSLLSLKGSFEIALTRLGAWRGNRLPYTPGSKARRTHE